MSQIKINLQESKVGCLVTSLNYLKMTLKNGLKYDLEALNMLPIFAFLQRLIDFFVYKNVILIAVSST